jgi:hypothetical protein
LPAADPRQEWRVELLAGQVGPGRQAAGHAENGRSSISDPGMGGLL